MTAAGPPEGEGIATGELRGLRYFLAVADELSFSRAADRLHITQPGLSQGIKALERRVGMPLFERDRQRVALTSAGEALLPKARHLLAQAEEFDCFASVLAGRHNGTLTLSYCRSGGIGVASDVTRRFRETYPNITVETSSGHTHPTVERIRTRAIDVGFVRPPIGVDGLRCSVIAHDPVVAAVPAGHRLAELPSVTPRDLMGAPLVFFPRERSGLWESLLTAVYGAGAEPEISHVEPDEPHMLAAVARGEGITLLPEPSAALLAVPGVAVKRFTTPRTVPMALAWRRDNANAALHTFLSFVHGAVGSGGPGGPARGGHASAAAGAGRDLTAVVPPVRRDGPVRQMHRAGRVR